MQRSATALDWLVFAALGVAWGSSYLFIKIGVETLQPLDLVAGRLAIGTAVLAVFLLAQRQALPRSPSVYGHLVMQALLGIVIPFTLITWGEQSIDSGLAAILNGTVPLFALVMAALVLADEPLTANKGIGLMVGFLGVVAVTSPSFASGLGGSLPGEAMLMIATVSYAAAGVYARRFLSGIAPLVNAFFEVGFAFVISLALALAFEPLPSGLDGSSLLAVGWLGLVGSGLAFLAFFHLLGRMGAAGTTQVAYLLPVVGVVLGAAVRGEPVTPVVIGGMALVLVGVALANRPSRSAARPAAVEYAPPE